MWRDVWTSRDHKLTNGPDIVNIVGLRYDDLSLNCDYKST